MAKPQQHENTGSNPSSRGTSAPDAMMQDATQKLMKQMEDLGRAMMGSVQQATESNWELMQRMSSCTDPMEATRQVTDWMNARRDALLSDGRRMTDLWLQMYRTDLEVADETMRRVMTDMSTMASQAAPSGPRAVHAAD